MYTVNTQVKTEDIKSEHSVKPKHDYKRGGGGA